MATVFKGINTMEEAQNFVKFIKDMMTYQYDDDAEVCEEMLKQFDESWEYDTLYYEGVSEVCSGFMEDCQIVLNDVVDGTKTFSAVFDEIGEDDFDDFVGVFFNRYTLRGVWELDNRILLGSAVAARIEEEKDFVREAVIMAIESCDDENVRNLGADFVTKTFRDINIHFSSIIIAFAAVKGFNTPMDLLIYEYDVADALIGNDMLDDLKVGMAEVVTGGMETIDKLFEIVENYKKENGIEFVWN